MFTKIFYFCITAAVCFVFVSNSFAADSNDLSYAPDRILVKFAQTDGKQKTITERNAVLSTLKAGSVKRSFDLVPGLNLVELPKDVNVPYVLKLLKNDPNFIYVEPNKIPIAKSCYPCDSRFQINRRCQELALGR